MRMLEQVYQTGSIEAGQSPSPPRAVTPVLPISNYDHHDANSKTTLEAPKRERKHQVSPPKIMGVYSGQRKRSRTGSSGLRQTTLSPKCPGDHILSLTAQANHLDRELASTGAVERANPL